MDPSPERSNPGGVSGIMVCYTDDSEPGITRRRKGRYWQYFHADGSRVTDRDVIDRLNKLAVPPAYDKVWYCPKPNGHLQATGIDARGRKQYRYHADYRAAQEASKYDRCAAFGQALPAIRTAVEGELDNGRGLGKERVIAAVVRLLDVGHIRVGNSDYAKANKSYGATTLLNRHADVAGGKVKLKYRGKSGKVQEVAIADRALARLVRRTQDLPGQALFQYVGGDGEPRSIGSTDVNDWLRSVSGGEFTAKHFRTWGASVIAFETLAAADPERPPSLKTMLEPVAAALGNTPAISRKSYVHPLLIERARDGDLGGIAGEKLPRPTRYLSGAERGLIDLLEGAARPKIRR